MVVYAKPRIQRKVDHPSAHNAVKGQSPSQLLAVITIAEQRKRRRPKRRWLSLHHLHQKSTDDQKRRETLQDQLDDCGRCQTKQSQGSQGVYGSVSAKGPGIRRQFREYDGSERGVTTVSSRGRPRSQHARRRDHRPADQAVIKDLRFAHAYMNTP